MKKLLLALFLLVPLSAGAQSVQQSGSNVTPGHNACWATTGVIYDCGVTSGPSIVGSTTQNDFTAFNGSGSLIDSGISAVNTSSITALWNFNGGATGPTRSLNDDTTYFATTAFVQNAFASGPTFAAPVTINATNATTTRGLIVNQQPAGTLSNALNFLNGTFDTNWNINAGGNLVAANGTQVIVNGAAAQAGNGMFSYFADLQFEADAGVTSQSAYAALIMRGLVVDSPTATNFYIAAGNCNVAANSIIWPTGSQQICFEADSTTTTAGLAGRAMLKFVLDDPNNTNVQGSGFDALIYAQTVPLSSAYGYQNFALLDATYGNIIASNGCVLCTRGSATISEGIDFSSWTTSTFLKSTGFLVDGSGHLQIGLNSGTVAGVLAQIQTASGHNFAILNETGGPQFSCINNAVNTLIPCLFSASNWSIDASGNGIFAGLTVSTGNLTVSTGSIVAPTFSGLATFSGQFVSTFGTPAIASGACGTTTNGTIAGSNQSGIITIGPATTTSCTISFSTTITAPNACVFSPGNSVAAAQGTTLAYSHAFGTTSWILTGSALTSGVYNYICL